MKLNNNQASFKNYFHLFYLLNSGIYPAVGFAWLMSPELGQYFVVSTDLFWCEVVTFLAARKPSWLGFLCVCVCLESTCARGPRRPLLECREDF